MVDLEKIHLSSVSKRDEYKKYVKKLFPCAIEVGITNFPSLFMFILRVLSETSIVELLILKLSYNPISNERGVGVLWTQYSQAIIIGKFCSTQFQICHTYRHLDIWALVLVIELGLSTQEQRKFLTKVKIENPCSL